MAIKKLQNDFTTPEQSERLLKLGVPRYSADCYYGQRKSWTEPQPMIIGDSGTQYKVNTRNDIIPCWSVGRLIEIALICLDWLTFSMRMKRVVHLCIFEKAPFVEAVVNEFDTKFDFSKLEE